MRIVCQQTILMKYHALFVIFWKSSKIWKCRLLQIIGGALWVKVPILCVLIQELVVDIYLVKVQCHMVSDLVFRCMHCTWENQKKNKKHK